MSIIIGLGREGTGRVIPIDIIDKTDRCGMGYTEDAFQRLLEAKEKRERENAAKGGAPAPKDPRREVEMHKMGSEFRQHVQSMLEELKDISETSDVVNEIRFPASITKEERVLVHKMARQMSLKSKSFGKGEDRYITVSSRNAEDEGSSVKHYRCTVCDCPVTDATRNAHAAGKRHNNAVARLPPEQWPSPETVFEEEEPPKKTRNVRDFPYQSTLGSPGGANYTATPPPNRGGGGRRGRGGFSPSFRGGSPLSRGSPRGHPIKPFLLHSPGGAGAYRPKQPKQQQPADSSPSAGRLKTINLNAPPKLATSPGSPGMARDPKKHKRKSEESQSGQKEDKREGKEKEAPDSQEQGGEVLRAPAEKKVKRKPKLNFVGEDELGGGRMQRTDYFGGSTAMDTGSTTGIQNWFSSQQPTQPLSPSSPAGKKAGRGGRGGRGFRGGRGHKHNNNRGGGGKRKIDDVPKNESN